MGTREHIKHAPKHLTFGILTVSSTRGLADDKSGLWMKKAVEKEGHAIITHQVAPDDAEVIARAVNDIIFHLEPQILLITGGTGLSPTDVTIEAVRPMFTKELTAFGVLFAQFSAEQIDSAAILSRATAGLIRQTAVFCLPGSLKACKLACKTIILPEAVHLAAHVRPSPS
jgi:molybdopterin adenylyltransferase